MFLHFQQDKDLSFQEFKMQDFSQYFEMFYESYTKSWKQNGIEDMYTKQEQLQYSKQIIKYAVEASNYVNKRDGTNTRFNTILRKKGKMISAYFIIDINYFIYKIEPNLKRQQIKFPKQLIDKNLKGCIGLRTCVRNQEKKSGYFLYHIYKMTQDLVKSGYQISYGTSYNEAAVRGVSRSTTVKQIKTSLIQFRGKTYKKYDMATYIRKNKYQDSQFLTQKSNAKL